MNIQNVHRKNRKAISPVLATVILIAITLIAAVAIATFVFGIFGTSASPATLSVLANPAPTCLASTGVCTMTVHNGGSASGSITGATSVNSTSPVLSGAPVSVAAGGNSVVTLTYGANVMVAGQTITIGLVQGNGPNIPVQLVVS